MNGRMAADQDMRKSSYFEGWLAHKGSGTKEYTNLYIVLRKRKLYIYPNNETDDFKPLGSLSLDRFTTVKMKDRGGYRLEIRTASSQVTNGVPLAFKENTFKAITKIERNLWYAFIVSLSQGTVPSNVTLHPNEKAMMEDAIQDCLRLDDSTLPGRTKITKEPATPPLFPKTEHDSPNDWPDRAPPPPPNNGSMERMRRVSNQSNRPLPLPPTTRKLSQLSSGSDESKVSSGETVSIGVTSGTPSSDVDQIDGRRDGPFMYHKFYMNRGNCHNVPTWFFENCTRELAEMVLTFGKRYGNVMMRESTTYRQSGSYVIDIREETKRGSSIRHFEVIRVAGGFKIDLLNMEHEPMCCLSEAMSFVTQCMGPEFRPMSTNDRKLIGIPEPEYDRVLNPDVGMSRSPIEEDNYVLPDTLRRVSAEEEGLYATASEPDYMSMRHLRETSSQSGTIARPRPIPQQPAYDVPHNNNPFCDAEPR